MNEIKTFLKQYKVSQLRILCSQRGLQKSGKKDILIQRLYDDGFSIQTATDPSLLNQQNQNIESIELPTANVKTNTIVTDQRISTGFATKRSKQHTLQEKERVSKINDITRKMYEEQKNMKLNQAEATERSIERLFKFMNLLDRVQGRRKLPKTHPISMIRLQCYKHIMGIIANSLVLNANDDDEDENDHTREERTTLINEMRKHADLPSEKILYEQDDKIYNHPRNENIN